LIFYFDEANARDPATINGFKRRLDPERKFIANTPLNTKFDTSRITFILSLNAGAGKNITDEPASREVVMRAVAWRTKHGVISVSVLEQQRRVGRRFAHVKARHRPKESHVRDSLHGRVDGRERVDQAHGHAVAVDVVAFVDALVVGRDRVAGRLAGSSRPACRVRGMSSTRYRSRVDRQTRRHGANMRRATEARYRC
jgi:hypothetical protein